MLANGFTVTAGGPALVSLSPASARRGEQNFSVALTGRLTNWVQGTTTGSFGAGVTVASLTVTSSTNAAAVLDIGASAALGARTVLLTTGAEVVTLSGGFTVTQAVNQPPVVSAGANQTITLGSSPVAFTEYPLPNGGDPREITMGPDGNLWFTEAIANRIGTVTPAGTITEFSNPSSSGAGFDAPEGIIAGPDGNLWFAEYLGVGLAGLQARA